MLRPEQISQYREQGYVLVANIFSPDELDRMVAAFDEIVRRRSGATDEVASGWNGGWQDNLQEMRLVHADDVQAYSAEWTRVLVHDRFTEAMADLIGPNVQLHHSKLFQKPPENGAAFPMHQDYAYFPHEMHSVMACTIHLSDSTEEMGCMRVVPASHKLGPLALYQETNGKKGALYLDPNEYPIEKGTSCAARQGDVLFFNYLTIHGSGINVSDRARKTVLVQVRDAGDRPTQDIHRSHSQGLMLRGNNPFDSLTAATANLGDQRSGELIGVNR